MNDFQLWNGIDFSHNKSFWKRWGHQSALTFRVLNLADAQNVLRESGISSSLYGTTLRHVVEKGELGEDHDDDLIVGPEDFMRLRAEGKAIFEILGFCVIRDTDQIFSIERDGRYVDIHPIHEGVPEVETVSVHGVNLQIHCDARSILQSKYGQRAAIGNLLGRFSTLFRAFLARPVDTVRRAMFDLNRRRRRMLGRGKSQRTVKLSEEQFLSLMFDARDSGNWIWRGQHMKTISMPGETLGQSLIRLAESGFIENYLAIENPLDHPVEEPVSLSRAFWKQGNNFFAYPLIFGFRHLVVPYQAANLYILSSHNLALYSRDYYQSLPKMTDQEIAKFLESEPIEVTNGAITSGRHRVAAMMGRLLRGSGYLPVWARIIGSSPKA